jgi:hypothetical protein
MPGRDDTAPMLRTIVWGTYFVQAAACVIGLVMAWPAIECALLGHHGHAILCAIGALISYATLEIAGDIREHARKPAEAADRAEQAYRSTQPPEWLRKTS